MNKQKIFNRSTKIQRALLWIFLILTIFFSVISAYSLRQNNLRAIELRDKLLVADQVNGDVEAALRTLRQHIYSHMNTNLSSGSNLQFPVQLKYRYERLVAAEKARVDAVNKQIYSQAQSYCEQKYGGGSLKDQRVPCVQQYINDNGVRAQEISDDLYKFNFVSPVWSPDLAGISMVLAVLFLCLFAGEVVIRHIVRLRSKRDF